MVARTRVSALTQAWKDRRTGTARLTSFWVVNGASPCLSIGCLSKNVAKMVLINSESGPRGEIIAEIPYKGQYSIMSASTAEAVRSGRIHEKQLTAIIAALNSLN